MASVCVDGHKILILYGGSECKVVDNLIFTLVEWLLKKYELQKVNTLKTDAFCVTLIL